MAIQLRDKSTCKYDQISLGEIMLRLDPGEGRVRTARHFTAWEGGGEYNTSRGLRKCFGYKTAVCTAFVDNEVGHLIEDFIMQGGVDTDFILWRPDDGIGRSIRNGLNFTERGFGFRGAVGVPDRGNSAASQLKPGDFDWDHIFGKAGTRKPNPRSVKFKPLRILRPMPSSGRRRKIKSAVATPPCMMKYSIRWPTSLSTNTGRTGGFVAETFAQAARGVVFAATFPSGEVSRGLRKCFGYKTAVCTAFVDNEVGHLIEDFIMQGGVDTDFILWRPDDGIGRSIRNGLNFTERGFGFRVPALPKI